MERLYFITDLDRTIIHSKNKGYICVEKEGEKEITYMTKDSLEKLKKLLRNEKFLFIPCTMRNKYQTLRVDVIREYNPEIMVCSNGAEIYINGEKDEEWNRFIKGKIEDCTLDYQIEKIKSKICDYEEIRNIEGFYITIKFQDEKISLREFNKLQGVFNNDFNLIYIRNKIFLIHRDINKENAVKYLIDKYKIKNLVTAGDSEVDEFFTTYGQAILPAHASFKHKEAVVTTKEGIHSTDEILQFLLGKI